jgi:large subunit ribosomal protein L25
LEVLKLKARPRTGTGKSYARKIRQQGWIPAVYYGHDRETKHIEVDANEFKAIVRAKQTTHLINLELAEESGDSTSIIKDVQKHVLNDSLYFHIDFQSVSMDEKITVDCPVVLTGTAVGVTEEGGILNQSIRTISVECLPSDIPEHIEFDVSELHMGKSIHVKDLSVQKAEIKNSPDDVIATVVQPQAIVEEVEEEVEGEEVEGEEVEGEEGEAKEGEAKEGETKDSKEAEADRVKKKSESKKSKKE